LREKKFAGQMQENLQDICRTFAGHLQDICRDILPVLEQHSTRTFFPRSVLKHLIGACVLGDLLGECVLVEGSRTILGVSSDEAEDVSWEPPS
jgi:hypothetical protein